MNAALLFSANTQPTDGLSLNSTPGAVLPDGDGPTNEFSTVMDGALSQQSRENSDVSQGPTAAGSEKPAASVAAVPAVIRQILAYLSPDSGKLASTTEAETVQIDEAPDLDPDEKQAMVGDAAAMLVACQLPPQLQLLAPTPMAPSAASTTANTMTISTQASASSISELPTVGVAKSAVLGLLGDLTPPGNSPIELDKKTAADDSRPLTRSPKVEVAAGSKPELDQSRSLVETLVPSSSSLLVGSQAEPVRDRLLAANLPRVTPSDDVDSSKPTPVQGQNKSDGQPELGTVLESVEGADPSIAPGAVSQSAELENGEIIDNKAAVALTELPGTERGVAENSVNVLNRRLVFPSPGEGSGPVAPAGTGGAKLDNRTMKSAEQDQNAGLRLQRLPSGTIDSTAIESGAGDLAGLRSGARPILNSELGFRPLVADFASQGAGSQFDAFDTSAAARTGGTVAERVERVEHLILKEASVVKQSGAESLAVVLKPDAQTELFLQINHRAGQIEATVRFDRGDAASLGLYWPQLQESLARMDVQLQPMKDSTPSSNGQSSFGSFESADQQNSPGQRTPRSMSWEGEPASGEVVAGRQSTRASVPRTRRQSGWESWA